MNYKIKFKITNCDCEAGHPQACSASFEEEFQVDAPTEEEAGKQAKEKMEKRYPGFTVECIGCCEHPLGTGGGCNVFDPADLKKQDTTQRKRS